MESLAVKYRPKTFDDVAEQSATKVILKQQLESGEVKNAYLFCGGAGTGKTTCARIFANEINKNLGIPIELDAASNNSVDDVRNIIQQSRTLPMDSEYKIFIIDECHALSNNAWQAFLKVLEEPPIKSIFIFCTTDPQKIPKTILSRIQRYDFQRISQTGIFARLIYILSEEFPKKNYDEVAVKYISQLAQGGMRDAITMLDKCLSYSDDLTVENVTKALGISSYPQMIRFLTAIEDDAIADGVLIIDEIYFSGYDLKQFIRSVTDFMLDVCKYHYTKSFQYLTCPDTSEIRDFFNRSDIQAENREILRRLINLQYDIKWDTNPKSRIEAWCVTGE